MNRVCIEAAEVLIPKSKAKAAALNLDWTVEPSNEVFSVQSDISLDFAGALMNNGMTPNGASRADVDCWVLCGFNLKASSALDMLKSMGKVDQDATLAPVNLDEDMPVECFAV